MDMRQIIGITLGVVFGALLVFIMALIVARVAAPYDIFGIKELFSNTHKDAWNEWQEEATANTIKTAIDDYFQPVIKKLE